MADYDNSHNVFSSSDYYKISSGSYFNNEAGDFIMTNDEVDNFGTFYNINGGVVYSLSTLPPGSQYASEYADLSNYGLFDNSGGVVYLDEGAVFSNQGTFINSSLGEKLNPYPLFDEPGFYIYLGTFTNSGTFDNSNGMMKMDGTFVRNYRHGDFINTNGYFYQSGLTVGSPSLDGFVNQGMVDNSNGTFVTKKVLHNTSIATFNNTNGTFDGRFLNYSTTLGIIRLDGIFDNTNGKFTGYYEDHGGMLKGSGQFIVNNLSINSGVFQPEGMTVEGRFTLSDTGEIVFLNPGNTALLSVTKNVALNGGTLSFGDLSTLTAGEFTLIDVTTDSSLTIDASLLNAAAATVDSFDTASQDFELVQRNNDLVLTVNNSGPDTLTGTSGNDTLTGTSSDEILNGLDGDDILRGNDGNDVLNGGLGQDIYYGGRGADTFVFTEADIAEGLGQTTGDVIKDFNVNEGDVIQLDLGSSSGNTPALYFDSANSNLLVVVAWGSGAAGFHVATLEGVSNFDVSTVEVV